MVLIEESDLLSITFCSGAASQLSSREWLIQDDNSKTTSNSAYPITEETESSLKKSPEAENDRVYKKRKPCLPNTTQIRPDMYSTGETQDNNGDKFSGKPPSQRASFRLSFGSNSKDVPKQPVLESLKSASLKQDNALLWKLFEDTTLTIIQTSTPELGLPLEVPLYWYFHALYLFGPDRMHSVICWCLQYPTEITVDLKKESKCWLFGPKLDFATTHWVNFVNKVNIHLGVSSYCAPKFTPCEQKQNTQPFVLFNQLTIVEDPTICLSPPYYNIKLDTNSFWSQLKRQVDGNQWHRHPMQGTQEDLEQVNKYQQAVIRAKKEEEERQKRILRQQLLNASWTLGQNTPV